MAYFFLSQIGGFPMSRILFFLFGVVLMVGCGSDEDEDLLRRELRDSTETQAKVVSEMRELRSEIGELKEKVRCYQLALSLMHSPVG
jgi:hypothetical protein